jgi:hypothetical protein
MMNCKSERIPCSLLQGIFKKVSDEKGVKSSLDPYSIKPGNMSERGDSVGGSGFNI